MKKLSGPNLLSITSNVCFDLNHESLALLLENAQVWVIIFYSLSWHGSRVFDWNIVLFGYLINCDAYLSNCRLLLVFRTTNNGSMVTADFRRRQKSTVGLLRKAIAPVTYFASKCTRQKLYVFLGTRCLCKQTTHNINNHVR